MKKILIINNIDYHYEILESLFTIFLKKIHYESEYKVYMFIQKNIEYQTYIVSKYENVTFLDNITDIFFDIEIYATIYPKDIKYIENSKINKKYYISHRNKIIIENNHNFINYHDAFKDVYIILALIDDTFEHNYFTIQLTSSISYSISYDIPILIYSKLNDIYEKDLKKSIVYKDQNEMNVQFRKLLNKFYDEK